MTFLLLFFLAYDAFVSILILFYLFWVYKFAYFIFSKIMLDHTSLNSAESYLLPAILQTCTLRLKTVYMWFNWSIFLNYIDVAEDHISNLPSSVSVCLSPRAVSPLGIISCQTWLFVLRWGPGAAGPPAHVPAISHSYTGRGI